MCDTNSISWRFATSDDSDIESLLVAFRHNHEGRRVVYLATFKAGTNSEFEFGAHRLEFLKEGLSGFLIEGWQRYDRTIGSDMPEGDLRRMAEAWLLDGDS